MLRRFKRHVDVNNQRWRSKVDEDLKKVNHEIKKIKEDVEELREKEVASNPIQEALKKDVKELKNG